MRAIAVMAVVIFHAFPTVLTGGFVGVDVFFVISGFLITQILREGVSAGTFTFGEFYERRIRRLFPALVLVVAVTALVGLFILPPGDLKTFGRSIGPSMLFAANVHFSHKIGYFAPPDDVRPLLHLWSLAVEEQFYILWPLVIWLGARLPGWVFRGVLAAAVALSLGADELASHSAPMAAFFHTPLRAWEPLTGAAIAVFWARPIASRWLREALAVSGLLAVTASFVLLKSTTPFPGLAAAPACVGAALLLKAGSSQARSAPLTWVARGLSWRPMVYVGAISYSLYLWHWPILTFLRLGSPGEPPAVLMAGGVVLSLGLAALTLRLIERPYRRRSEASLSRPRLFAAAIGVLVVFVGVGEALSADEGLRRRVGGEVARADQAEHDISGMGDCRGAVLGVPTRCAIGLSRSGSPDLVLIGDSEAEAWAAGVSQWASRQGLKGQLVGLAACPPVVGVGQRDPAGKVVPCAGHNAQVVDQIVADHRIRYVVLAARWALYDRGPDVDHPNAYLVGDSGRREPARFHGLLASGLTQLVDRLEAARAGDLTILILGPSPEFPLNPPRCAARALMVGRDPRPCLQAPAPPIVARQAGAQAILRAIAAAHPNIRLLSADSQLCDAAVCRAALDGQFMFRDGNHPTATGARRLERTLFAGVGR